MDSSLKAMVMAFFEDVYSRVKVETEAVKCSSLRLMEPLGIGETTEDNLRDGEVTVGDMS